jgi:hypothetical protein
MKQRWTVTVLDADSIKHTLALALYDEATNLEAIVAALMPLGLRLLRAEPVMEDASA